jgi:hypothetical protein
MAMPIQISPQAEARIMAAARRHGTDASSVLDKLVIDHLPAADSNGVAETIGRTSSTPSGLDEEKAAALAFLESLLAQVPSDPEELRKNDAEFREFMDNLNTNRLI